jgi:hypothetical protein
MRQLRAKTKSGLLSWSKLPGMTIKKPGRRKEIRCSEASKMEVVRDRFLKDREQTQCLGGGFDLPRIRQGDGRRLGF